MHIPDAYLSPATQIGGMAVMTPVLAVAARRTRASLLTKQVPLLSVGAAFCFAIQMFNIPAIGGTTAHALGTVLLAILLGPWAAIITMTLTLAVQALLFGDGGILSLGVNSIDMALIPTLVGYSLYTSMGGQKSPGSPRALIAAAVAAYAGTAVASLSAGFFLGVQPLIAHDAAGHALYFPFGLAVSVPAMVYTHLLIAAPAEGIITLFSLAYVWKNFPDLSFVGRQAKIGSPYRLGRTVGLVLLLTPLGLLAGGAAFGEWDPGVLKNLIGYVPSGAANSRELVHPLLSGYSLPGVHGHLWEIAGYLLSALVGSALVMLVTRTAIGRAARTVSVPPERAAAGLVLPAWMGRPNPGRVVSQTPGKRWIEPLLLRMRGTIEETIATERIARMPGLLQRMQPTPKAMLAICGLLAVALASGVGPLLSLLSLIVIGAALSGVPLGPFARRVAFAVAFFGLIVAVPLAFQAVTPGKSAFQAGPVILSENGLDSALAILVRLACGISLTLLWTLTTRWHDLVRSLRNLGMPAFLTTGISLAYRTIFVTIETLEEMVTARRSRQAGQIDKRQAREYAGAGAAILFAKSYAFSEDLHMAMRSRCFDRIACAPSSRRWTRSESLSVAGGLLLVLVLVSLKVIHAV